jgi:hypothetical protein
MICHQLAEAYVMMKIKSHNSFLLKEECSSDLAWDFIADLFQKDESGNLTTFQGYFDSLDLDTFNEHELFIELRKLVFTKVDDGVFRYYGEKDPSLKKIIRNIKLSVRNRDCKSQVCYKDGFLLVDDSDSANQAAMPEDFMRIKLCSRLEEQMQIPQILVEVIDILDQQEEYRKRFSLVILAKIIRESFVLIQDEQDNGKMKPKAEREMLKMDVELFLHKSVSKIKRDLAPGYVSKGKLEPGHVDVFFKAAADIVRDDLTQQSGLSQFDRIKSHFIDLEYDQYRKKHRSVLEYMVKLIRTDLVNNIKKDWI